MDKDEIKIVEIEKQYKRITMLALIVGIITIVDYILPDPIVIVDEVVLSVILGYLTWKQRILDRKLKKLLKDYK